MIKTEVTLRDNRCPSRFITMPMSEYRNFIEEQAGELGIIPRKMSQKEINEIKLLIKSPSKKELDEMYKAFFKKQCPRCQNEEIDDDANFCIICGLPVEREENDNVKRSSK